MTMPAVPPARPHAWPACMQGSCLEPPDLGDFNLTPGAPLLPLKHGQCLLVTRSGFLKSGSGPLWLDNLYIRREQPAETTGGATPIPVNHAALTPLVVTDKPEGLLWATGVAFQGDGGGGAAAVEIYSAAFFDGVPAAAPAPAPCAPARSPRGIKPPAGIGT